MKNKKILENISSSFAKNKKEGAKEIESIVNPESRCLQYLIAPKSVYRNMIEEDEKIHTEGIKVEKKKMQRYVIAPASEYFKLLNEDKNFDKQQKQKENEQ